MVIASYDGVILGAGHNGRILQAYLGKAVRALERDSGYDPLRKSAWSRRWVMDCKIVSIPPD
jgi:hypothetical protein